MSEHTAGTLLVICFAPIWTRAAFVASEFGRYAHDKVNLLRVSMDCLRGALPSRHVDLSHVASCEMKHELWALRGQSPHRNT